MKLLILWQLFIIVKYFALNWKHLLESEKSSIKLNRQMIEDLISFLAESQRQKSDDFRNGQKVEYDVLNHNFANLTFSHLASDGCDEEIRLLILVKSATTHFERRLAIRSIWGNPNRFSDVKIKTVFLLGQLNEDDQKLGNVKLAFLEKELSVKEAINAEISKFADIVQGDFIDSYYNNTYKSIMGMKWAANICTKYRYAFIVDDDMYVSVKNLLKFVRNPTGYPEYWERMKIKEYERQILKSISQNNYSRYQLITYPKVVKNSPYDFDIDLAPDARLYAGYVFFVPPLRHKIFNKWFVTLDEYPYDYYPPYVPAGSIILSKPALEDIYYASLFTKFYRFDDVFIAICAKKMGIQPFHSDYVRFWPPLIKNPQEKDYDYVISMHGFSNPEELVKFWRTVKSLGNA